MAGFIIKILWLLNVTVSSMRPTPKDGNLYYCDNGSHAFWIAGYTRDGNTSVVKDKIESLMELQVQAAALFNCKPSEVRTHYVLRSRRYQSCRVMYVETDFVPKEAYVITNQTWTMWSWLQD